MNNAIKKSLPAIFTFLILILAMETASRQGFVPESLLPSPSSILKTLWELRQDFTTAFKETLGNVLIGFLLSFVAGTTIAFLFSLSKILKKAILPFAIFFQTVPIIAVAPLLVIYLGFGAPTVIAASFIVSIFPIIANTLMGLESPEREARDLFRIYNASKLATLIKLQLPSAYSYIYSGLKISAGLAIIGAIAGEFVAGSGLGAMIDAARTQQRVDIVFAALLLLAIMGLLIIGTLKLLHLMMNSRRPYARGSL